MSEKKVNFQDLYSTHVTQDSDGPTLVQLKLLDLLLLLRLLSLMSFVKKMIFEGVMEDFCFQHHLIFFHYVK